MSTASFLAESGWWEAFFNLRNGLLLLLLIAVVVVYVMWRRKQM